MNTPLTDILPAKARQALYALYSLAVIVVGALAVADVDTGKAADVLAYLGGALGLVAASNVGGGEGGPDERGESTVSLVVGVLLVVVLVLVIVRLV